MKKDTNYEEILELYDKGLSWDEIREELPWFTDTDRKKFYGWKEAMETLSNTMVKDKFDDRLQKIRLQQKILGLERSINNEQIRDLALRQVLGDQLREALKDIEPIKLGSPKFTKAQEKNDVVYVIALSDLHYDGDIRELPYIFKSILEAVKRAVVENDVKSIILIEGGDIIEGAGNLRNSQAQVVKSGMIPQFSQIMPYYISLIQEISKFVNIERFITVTSSNHTQIRPMGSKQNELVEEDLMVLFGQWLAMMFPELDITYDVEPSFTIGHYLIKLMHGHTVRNRGDLSKELHHISSYEQALYDYVLAGHFHHYEQVDVSTSINEANGYEYDRQFIMLPSLDSKGTSTFEKSLRVSSTAGIGLLAFCKERGLLWGRKVRL